MRVAFDVGPVLDRPTGVGLFALAMANALTRELEPDEIVLIGRRSTARGLSTTVASMDIHGLPYGIWLQAAAPRDAAKAGADLIHHSNGMVPLVRSRKTFLSVHDMSLVRHWRTHPVRRVIQLPLALVSPRLADLIIVPSRATADEVTGLTGVRARRVEIVPYAPQDQIQPADAAQVQVTLSRHHLERHEYVLSLGTIEPRKNHIRLIDAFELAIAAKSIPRSTPLVLVGKLAQYSGRVLARISASPYKGQIKLLGYLPSSDLYSLLTGAAVVVYVSLYEGFGLPVIEALACGAPTVTSEISSMPEVAGDAGFLVDPFDPTDIARGMAAAFSAGMTGRQPLAARAIARASTFTWQRAARATAEIYRSA